MGARRLTRATFATLLTTMTAAAILTGPSAAGQPPDSLDDQIAAADAELKKAQVRLAKTYEAFTTADKRHRRATAAAKTASDKATRASAEADAAAKRERDLRVKFDRFASANFNQRSSLSSVRAYLSASSPSDLMDRASMLNILSGEYVDVLDATGRAVDKKSAAERAAQTAQDQSVRNRDAAAKAKADAERTYEAAVAIQDDAKAESARLADRRAALVAAAADADAAGDDAPRSSGGNSGSSVSPPVQVTASGAVVKPAEGTLTSGYGARWGTIHYGIDIANSIGTPILSAMAGQVIEAGPASGFGQWVRVQHGNGLITVYGHINEWTVNVGQQVAAGEQIATIGNEGQSTGPHLHFEVHQDGSKIDPLPWLRSHGVNI